MNTKHIKAAIYAAIQRAFPWVAKSDARAPGPVSTPHLNSILLHLCGGDRELALSVHRWVAHPLRNPVARNQQAIWLYGGQGSGKTMIFGQLFAPLFEANAAVIGKHVGVHFNGWMENASFALIDEHDWHSWSLAHIKHLITSDHLVIERKAKPAKTVANGMNMVFMSSHVDALVASADTRRFMVIDVPPPLPGKDYIAAAKELENGAHQAWSNYLRFELDLASAQGV